MLQMISLCHIGYVCISVYKSGGTWNTGEEISRGMHQSESKQNLFSNRKNQNYKIFGYTVTEFFVCNSEQFVFFLMEHFLLILRLISAIVLFGASMKARVPNILSSFCIIVEHI